MNIEEAYEILSKNWDIEASRDQIQAALDKAMDVLYGNKEEI